ncbi:PepSY domain-containing protein [Parasalinivibrio latis]|uniref:PepSY-associated TM helix domain-containing protein n=1 Tax=Parasalinivibrio latis TaxID=2952610 RepID=UPI0030DF65E7
MSDVSINQPVSERSPAKHLQHYIAVWRWHFYSGLFVVPFMIMLSITGIGMLWSNSIDTLMNREMLKVSVPANSERVSLVSLQRAVSERFPDATIRKYITPQTEEDAAQFSVKIDSANHTVFINPYTAEITGSRNEDGSFYSIMNDIHGNLLIGDWGDRFVELSASLGIIMIVSGLYLWLPRSHSQKLSFFRIRMMSGSRIFLRDLHANLGGASIVVLLFFLLSGLAWTGVWGSKLVQPWSSFPEERYKNVPVSDINHATMNTGSVEEVPWNLELTKMPASRTGIENQSGVQNLDTVAAQAAALGLTTYRINLPLKPEGVYTISAATMSGDINDPTEDITVHIDRYTGEILANIGWEDYNLMAKAMAAGVALHEGGLGTWNLWVNTVFCLFVLLIAVSGVIMWWQRRPQNAKGLEAPPRQLDIKLTRSFLFVMVAVSVLVPLAAVALIGFLLFDYLVTSRFDKLRRLLN